MLLAEDTLPRLTDENGHLQKTVAKLTSQLDETEGRLQTELAARQALEADLDGRVRDVEQTWTAALDESRTSWEAKEAALEAKVADQERLLVEVKASYEVSQRLDHAAGGGGDANLERRNKAASAEIGMLHSDLERTRARLAEVEARNERLRVEVAQAKSQAPQQQQQSATAVEDDPAFMRVRSENSSLARKLDAVRMEKETLRRSVDGRMRGLEREVGLLTEERDALKARMDRWSDYEEVRQELEVLKSIEFSTGDDDEAVKDGGAQGGGGGDTLEKLLLARNKKLGDELTVMRVSHQDLQSRLEAVQEQLVKAGEDRDAARALNEKLENDLATLQSEGANMFPSGASVAGTYVNRYQPSIAPSRRGGGGGGGGRISPTSSIISGVYPRGSDADSVYGGGGAAAGPGILPMITAQRDRFKKRMAELERELAGTHRTVSELREEVAALQRDNLALYEKTRYVSAFNRGGGGGAAGGGGSGAQASTSSSAAYASANPTSTSIHMGSWGGGPDGDGGGGGGMDRYRKAYESNLSPFAAWRGRESARMYRHMSLPERLVYSVTRMALATRTSRNLFALYCVGLHLLVFLAVYNMGGSCEGAGAVGAVAPLVGTGAAGMADAASAMEKDGTAG
jgi:homeobox protein cut-like